MVVPTVKQTIHAHHINLNRNGTKLDWNDTVLTQLHHGSNPTTKMTLERTTKYHLPPSNINKSYTFI